MKVAVSATESAADVAAAINAVERRVRAAVPVARVLYIEPDIFDPTLVDAPAKSGPGYVAPGHAPGADDAGSESAPHQ